MTQRPHLLSLFCIALCAALLQSCTFKQKDGTVSTGQPLPTYAGTHSQGSGIVAGRSGPARFTPVSRNQAVALTRSEASALIKEMNPREQGLGSWKDFSFPVSQSLAYASSRPQNSAAVSLSGLNLSYGRLTSTLGYLQSVLPKLDSDPEILARDFTWYRIGPDFLYTGYFEPTLKASKTKSAQYPYPIYRVPPDLRKNRPYHTRNAIDRQGVLSGKGLEIAWVSSEMDAFFLHIQGSGRLVYEDGTASHILYAGKNNRPYVPLGRVLKERGLLEPDNINMQTIRECLLGNPEKCAELYDTNPSYIFFREAPQGPLGAMGRPLTPYVSIATDRSVLPHGSLVFAITSLPDTGGQPNRSFYGLVLPQDTGGAIRNRRIDLFCGPGDNAAHNAGYMNYQGAVYILVKK